MRWAVRKTIGRLAKPPGVLDHLRQLEAVHLGHLDVEDDGRDVVLQQQAQRPIGVLGPQEPIVGALQDRLQRVEVPGLVVNQQYVDGARHYSLFVSSITSRSMPTPTPPAGGIPCSSA